MTRTMNVLIHLLPKRSQLVFSEDVKPECLTRIRDAQCPMCLMVLKEHSHVPFGIDFVDPQAMDAPMVTMFKPSVSIVRSDLVELLRPWSNSVSFGVITEAGRTRADYMTMWFSRSGLIDMYSDEKPVPPPCPRCFRRCETGFESFYYHSDLAGRDVVARCGGSGLCISDRVFRSIPQALKNELKFKKYQCRSSKPTAG